MGTQTNVPDSLLEDIQHAFCGEPFGSFEHFVREVEKRQNGCGWSPHEPILDTPRVRIWTEHMSGDDPLFELRADNGQFFTTAELLFKIHNTCVRELRERDHHILAGLFLSDTSLETDIIDAQSPIYELDLDS